MTLGQMGFWATRLSFPTMGFHIDFPAINHSKVAPDTNCLTRLFLTENYCKALSRAVLFSYGNFHIIMNLKRLRARSGLRSYIHLSVAKKIQSIHFLK